jgi:hypothetical protein
MEAKGWEAKGCHAELFATEFGMALLSLAGISRGLFRGL